MTCLHNAANGAGCCGTHPESASEPHPQAAGTFLCAADLPFTLIGDVVTWPYTAAYNFINSPVPTPPVTPAPGGPPLTYSGSEKKESEKKESEKKEPEKKTPEKDMDGDKGQPKEDKPAPLPMFLP
jgi:hypothetical protein